MDDDCDHSTGIPSTRQQPSPTVEEPPTLDTTFSPRRSGFISRIPPPTNPHSRISHRTRAARSHQGYPFYCIKSKPFAHIILPAAVSAIGDYHIVFRTRPTTIKILTGTFGWVNFESACLCLCLVCPHLAMSLYTYTLAFSFFVQICSSVVIHEMKLLVHIASMFVLLTDECFLSHCKLWSCMPQ